MKTTAKVIRFAVNVDTYGVTVSDGKREETYQIARIPFGKGRICSHESAKTAAIRLFEMHSGRNPSILPLRREGAM
jgi:hypothetical protein